MQAEPLLANAAVLVSEESWKAERERNAKTNFSLTFHFFKELQDAQTVASMASMASFASGLGLPLDFAESIPVQDMAIRVYSAKSKALLSTLPPPPNSKVHEFPRSKIILYDLNIFDRVTVSFVFKSFESAVV